MTAEEVFIELRKLNRADKIRAIQVLASELASEEDLLLTPGARYDIWSPYDAPAAAEALLAMLDDASERQRNG